MQIQQENEDSFVTVSGDNAINALEQHFSYELSDKKARSNLVKGAAREALVLYERQKCTVLQFSVGSYLKTVIPVVCEWSTLKGEFTIDGVKMKIEDVRQGFDEKKKHVETLLKFQVSGNKITVACYNTTQRMKVEGRGYLDFVSKYLKPFFLESIRKVSLGKIEQYNKNVIASLTGKRKAVSRPMRSLRYRVMEKIPCTKCEMSFVNNSQLIRHKKNVHSVNESYRMPLVDDGSLLEISSDEEQDLRPKQITLQENRTTEEKVEEDKDDAGRAENVLDKKDNMKKQEIVRIEDLVSCDRCEFDTENENSLNSINAKVTMKALVII